MEHKSDVKEKMMPMVVFICLAVILAVAVLFFLGFHKEPLSFAFWEFFMSHKLFSAYLVVINIIAFAAFGIDKRRAVKGKYRIKIVTLIRLAFLGGSIGALAGMYTFRHKTRVNYFAVGVPLIIVAQTALLFYVMNI